MALNFDTVNQAYSEGEINVTSSYYSYIVLLFITVLLIFLLIKFSLTGQQGGAGGKNFKNEVMLLLGIMIVFLGLSNIFKNYNTYIFVSILLIAHIVAKIKLNQ